MLMRIRMLFGAPVIGKVDITRGLQLAILVQIPLPGLSVLIFSSSSICKLGVGLGNIGNGPTMLVIH